MSLKKRMTDCVNRQLEGVPSSGAGYMLSGFSASQLELVARFIRSFKREKKTRYKDEIAALRADRVTLQKENAELRGQLDLLTKVDEAAQPEFPDPAPAEELVLERGSIVRIRKGTHTGLAELDHKRVWEVVGFFSPESAPSMVQLGMYPWNSESPRPMHWAKLDYVVGLAE